MINVYVDVLYDLLILYKLDHANGYLVTDSSRKYFISTRNLKIKIGEW